VRRLALSSEAGVLQYLGVELKYPHAMSALVEGHSLPEPQRSQSAGAAQAVAAVTPGMAAGMTNAVWTMKVLLSYCVPRHFVALSSTLSRDTTLIVRTSNY
jgi:hypothetical protein